MDNVRKPRYLTDDEDILSKDAEDKWLQKKIPELYAWIQNTKR